MNEFQSSLAEGEWVIEYVLGPSDSTALAINRDRVAHYRLRSRAELESAVDLYLTAVHEKRDGRAEAKALYQLLVAPVANIAGSRRLVIIPDGKLHLVPFGALVDSTDRYIEETKVLSYAPSATVQYLLSRPQPSAATQVALLGIGGAQYEFAAGGLGPSLRGPGFFDPTGPPRWSAIPKSLKEITDIAASRSGNTLLLTGKEATETALKRLPLSTYRVLHFALHSAIDPQFPDRSALVLSSRRNDDEDDLLQAREILRLPLNADLVTLSACDTGVGKIEGIAGMNSLVQAFLMAGSRSVVASIWAADDTFTAALMHRFYGNLRAGRDKAEALTLAKRELLRMHGPTAVPFYWAGFRLVGDAHGRIPGE